MMQATQLSDHSESAPTSHVPVTKVPLEHYLSKTLVKLGFMPQNSGFKYAKLGIIFSSSGMLGAITRDLYPILAKIFSTSICSVERCIRHSLKSAFQRGHLARLNELFGANIVENYPMSNGEFLALMAEHVYYNFDKDEIINVVRKYKGVLNA